MPSVSVPPSPVDLPESLIIGGYGIKAACRDGCLVITGSGGQNYRIPRQPRTVRRIAVIADTGYITLEAQRWMTDAGISYTHIDSDGRIISTSGPQREDARLIRAQALAPGEVTGLEITRSLLTAKLNGQASVCRDVLRVPDAALMIDDLCATLADCPELDDCRSTEGAAAVAYWGAWQERVSVPFSVDDMMRVPSHWLKFSGRTSVMHDHPRNIHATCPTNALLNYAYRIAETEALFACHSVGLHPELGVLHSDKRGRDSMALDLIEAVRPICDRLVLGMLDVGLGVPRDDKGGPAYFDRRWITETREGQCRLVPPATTRLASRAAEIGAAIRPHAEHVARILASAAIGNVSVPKARKPAKTAVVPKTSNRPARLRDGVCLSDVMPDELWARIEPLIPEPPSGPHGHRKTGRPRDTALDREALAVNIATELLGIPYASLGATISVVTAHSRRREYQWTQSNGITAWERIASEVQGHGHLSALV